MGSSGQYTQGEFTFVAVKASVGTWARLNDSTQLAMGQFYNSTEAQNDEFTKDRYFDSVTWKNARVYTKNSNVGIATIQLDGSSVGTIDGYDAVEVINTYSEITGIAIAAAGVKTEKVLMATKNASATAYRWREQSNCWIRTGGTPSTPAGTDTPGYTWEWIPWMGSKANTSWDTRVQASDHLSGGRLDSAGTQNNVVSADAWLEARTYKYAQIHRTATNIGIYTVQLDGVSQGTIDGYTDPAVINVYTEITGIAVTPAAVKEFSLIMATKNASSAGYSGHVNTSKWISTGA